MKVRMILDLEITDEAKLLEYARRRVRETFDHELEDLYEARDLLLGALYEALIASNENPDPSDYGIDFLAWRGRELDPIDDFPLRYAEDLAGVA